MESTRVLYVLYYTNSQQFMGRYNNYWGRTRDVDVATLYESRGEAKIALAALLQEAQDRVSKKQPWAYEMWWDIYGGLVEVREVDIVTRLRERP